MRIAMRGVGREQRAGRGAVCRRGAGQQSRRRVCLKLRAVFGVVGLGQRLHAGGQIAAALRGQGLILKEREHLLLGKVRHEQVRCDALRRIGLRRGDEHDLLPAQALARGRNGHRVDQRLARAAADQVHLKAAALPGEEIRRMGADVRRLQLARAKDRERIVLRGSRADERLAGDLLRDGIAAQRGRVGRDRRLHAEAYRQQREHRRGQTGQRRPKHLPHGPYSSSAAILAGVEISSRERLATSSFA